MSDSRWLDDAGDPARIALRQGLDEAERFTHSELRQRRVWARVSDPARTFRATRGAFLRGALVASAFTAVAAVAFVHMQPAPAGRPEAVAARPAPAAAAAAVPAAAAGSVVETRAGERIVRLLPRGARAEIAPRSIMSVDEQGRPELRRGEVHFSVAPSAGADAQVFAVRVLSYRVVVGGARFVVKAEASTISVAVEDGVAEIWNGSRMVRIGSGETWSSDAAAQRQGGDARRAAVVRGPREHAPATLPPAMAPSPTDLQDREDLAAARAARAAADPRRALAIYEHLATRTGPAAENAMYEIGGIYHDQLNQPAKAVAAWDRYRTRYPNGLLRAEADLSVIDTLASTEMADGGERALSEALAFLKRYPHNERRGEIARVVGDLYRSRDNCGAALDFYRSVPGAKVSASDADDAAFGQAACLYALRDAGAEAALRAYLSQRPRGRHARDASRLLGDKATP